jgi:two-component system sensor histidine kinase TorS
VRLPPKILAVDDNEINLKVLAAMLRKLGYTATYATNGTDAKRLISNSAFDIALIDLQLPDCDGTAIARHAMSIQGQSDVLQTKPRLILMTASDVCHRQDEFITYGFDGFLPKPFRIDQLEMILT